MKRTLSLKREALTEVSDHELLNVAGAALPTSPLMWCLNTWFACYTEAARSACCPTEA